MPLATFDLGVPEIAQITRTVYDYGKASWSRIHREFERHDWSYIDEMTVDEMERYLHAKINEVVLRHVPRRNIRESRSAHPWMNETCLNAIRAKLATTGSEEQVFAASECSRILFAEYLTYVCRMRDKLRTVKRGSKLWWKLTSEITCASTKCSQIPALKSLTGWVLDAKGKADLFANTFEEKSQFQNLKEMSFASLTRLAWRMDGY